MIRDPLHIVHVITAVVGCPPEVSKDLASCLGIDLYGCLAV